MNRFSLKTRLAGGGVAAGIVVLLLMAAPLSAQNEGPGQGRAVITVLPAKGAEAAPNLSQQDLQLKVDGKAATVTNFLPLRGAQDRLEIVLLLDSGARTSMSTQFGDIKKFINGLPPSAKVTLAYMENGAARLTGPLTTDHNSVSQHLRVPSGPPGQDASPYFCLSDLARHWPSNDRGARREVVMISDGVDYYNPHYDPQDPYVQTSISDSVRAGLVVYSLYWENKGRFDGTQYANNSGQNLLLEVTQATGGNSYWEGFGNPVSFEPFFKDLDRRLQNQYEVGFTAPVSSKSGVETMKLKVNGISGKVDAPQQVFVSRAGM